MLVNPYIASHEQQRIIERLGTLSNITYKDTNVACHTIALAAYHQAMQGKASIIATQSADHKKVIWEHLQALGMAHLAYEINLFDTILDAEIVMWREWLQHQSKPKADEYVDAMFNFEQQHRAILTYYQSGADSKNHQFSIQKVLEKFWMLDRDPSLDVMLIKLDGLEIDFDLQTYNRIVAALQQAVMYYDASFELVDSKPYAGRTHAINDVHDLSYTLFGIKEKVQQFYQQFTSKILDIRSTYQSEQYKTISETRQAIDYLGHKINILQQKLSKPSPKSVFALWQKEDKTIVTIKAKIMDQWQLIADQFREHRLPLRSMTIDELVSNSSGCIDEMNSLLDQIESQIPSKVEEYLKSINRLNTNDASLDEVEVNLQSLFDEVNMSKVLDFSVEINTISLLKQYQKLESLLGDIKRKSLDIDHNLPYYRWMNIVEQYDATTVRIVDVLRQWESDQWLEMFNRWYYYNILCKHGHRTHHVDAEDLEQAYFDHLSAHQLGPKTLSNELSKAQKEQQAKDLKASLPALYKAVFQNKSLTEAIMWKTVIEEVSQWIAIKFPILIVDNDDMRHLQKGSYDSIFYLDFDNINPDGLQFFETIHTYIPPAKQDKITTDLTLSTFELDKDLYGSDLSMGQRLDMARRTTSTLLNVHSAPKIYQLRNASLVIFAEEFLANLIQKALYNHGVKEVLIDESLEKTMMATWLDADSPPIVIIENHLINTNLSDAYLWQLDVIHHIEQLGARVYNLKVNQQWDQGLQRIVGDVIENIKMTNLPQSTKNQLALEF